MKLIRTLVAAAACAMAGHAGAALLDFEDVYGAEFRSELEMWGIGTELYTQGYVLRYEPAPDEPYPTGFFAQSPLWRFTYRDTIAVNPNSCSARVTLAAQDNNPFNLLALDLQELNGSDDRRVRVTFTGVTAGQQTVTHSVTLDNNPKWQTLHFPHTFRQLQYVGWHQGDCIAVPPHMFDNILLMPSHLAP
jgi:hypothetical protein